MIYYHFFESYRCFTVLGPWLEYSTHTDHFLPSATTFYSQANRDKMNMAQLKIYGIVKYLGTAHIFSFIKYDSLLKPTM